jgi:hypothetical protein
MVIFENKFKIIIFYKFHIRIIVLILTNKLINFERKAVKRSFFCQYTEKIHQATLRILLHVF